MSNTKLLLIGDVHAVPSELDDCRALIGLVKEVAIKHQAEVVFMGDQYNSHNLINTEVLWFWRDTFNSLCKVVPKVHALVGNHDRSGANQLTHSMIAHENSIHVINEPSVIGEHISCVPFYDDNTTFVKEANATGGKTLLCHATFTGADYGGGFYAPDGIDPNLLRHNTVISGHIHSPQAFGKVTYIGAPRWRTLTDANLERAIWLYEFDETGGFVSKTPFDTGTVCRQIKTAEDTENFPIQLPLAPNMDWRIDIRGTAAYIEKRKAEIAGPGVKIRTFKTSSVSHAVKESEGIQTAFKGYLSKFHAKHGTSREQLAAMATDRLHV
jgi:DNA repair exonuclease SbcCD nuclease subunit